MNLFLHLLAVTLLLGACRQGPPAHTGGAPAAAHSSQQGYPVITFDQEVHDFGTVHEGEVVEYTFRFRNTGQAPLLITDAQATCGCTIPEWPKAPIKPGDAGELKVSFNSAGKEGAQEKSISLRANTETPFIPGPRIVCNVVK